MTAATEQNDVRGEIRRALEVLVEPGTTAELRALNTPRGTVSGYFNDLDSMADAAARCDGRAEGVYFTLNPVAPDLLARATNRVREYVRATTADQHVLRRRLFPIDIDFVRPQGISSTDPEHVAALERAREIASFLGADLDWPGLILGDSGNGAHVLSGSPSAQRRQRRRWA